MSRSVFQRAGPRVIGAILGLFAAMQLAGIVSERPRDTVYPGGPIISESDGALREIVIQYVQGAGAVLPVYRDFLSQLDADVIVNVLCPDRASYDELQMAIGARRCVMRARYVSHAMTAWSRDRWIALGSMQTDRVMLLAPHAEANIDAWPMRKGDEELAFDLSAQIYGVHARRSPFYFDGGDFLADDARVFVTPACVRANLQRTVTSVDELKRELQYALGKPVELLESAPDHHAGMFMMSAGHGIMVVGDPKLARSITGSDADLPPLPGGADWSAATQAKFDAVASQVAALGYKVVRIPTVVAADGKSYLTYVNVITDQRDGRHIVYLPQFRGAESLNAQAVKTWRNLGYEVRPVDCTSTYRLFGNLHCLVNVLRRA